MSVFDVVLSLLCGTLFLAAGLVVSLTVKRRFFSAWRGSLAITTVALVWLGWASAIGQLLGAVGLLRRVALLAAAALTAAATLALARKRPVDSGTPMRSAEPSGPAGWTGLALKVGTVLVGLLVAAIWTARTVIALHRGINDPDSLGYHVPFMVTFAHSGYANQHQYMFPLLPMHYFPAGDELLGAIGLALTHSLAFAAAKNLLFGVLVVVAAHAFGKAYGAAWLTAAAAAISLGTPVASFSQPGEAVNDVLLLFFMLGGLAVVAHARDRPAPYLLALASAGLALGVKFSGIVPAAALAALAVVLVLARVPRHRWRWAVGGLLLSAALGGSWYLRNAITYANPVPLVRMGIGPLRLPAHGGVASQLAFSVAHYAVQGRFLGVFARGLVRGLGPLIVVTGAICLLGGAIGLRSRDGLRRGLAAMAVVCTLGYLVTPASAFGTLEQVPESFVINLHYALPAFLAALVAGAIALARWRWAWIFPYVGVAAVATSISRGRGIAVWSPEIGGTGLVLLLVAAVAGAGVVLARTRPSLRRLVWPGAVVTAVVTVAGVAVIAGRYQPRRTTDPVGRWAATVHGANIAAWVGNVADLYGPQARNNVLVLTRTDAGAPVPIDTCQGWKQALIDGHFDYTAVISGTAWARWLKNDPAFRMVADERAGATRAELQTARRGMAVVFEIVGHPDVSCPGQTNSDADFWLGVGKGG